MDRDGETIVIREFRAADQAQVRRLVLLGLQEHWGKLDRSLNQDLNDIAKHYAGAVFLVAEWMSEKNIVGCGALVLRGDGVAEVVRMSVNKAVRRTGLGTRLLQALVNKARSMGLRRVVLETTETWHEVIAFYQRFGFRITHHIGGDGGDVYFAFDLGSGNKAATNDGVVLGTQVELALVTRNGTSERQHFTLVRDAAADVEQGLLGENTPLAKAILGRRTGDVVPYKAGDLKEVRVLAISMGNTETADLSARRAATREKMIRDADATNTLIFSTAHGSKWGDYDPDKLQKPREDEATRDE
jgi:N-acetylglutamate synthase-like GNAT family acetyltransferase